MGELGDWRDDAACREAEDPDLWWDGSPDAFRTCQGCPVRDDCLDAALQHPWSSDIAGVWGGTSPSARTLIRRGDLGRQEAMVRGDRLADHRTQAEQLADDEPWLLPSLHETGGAA